MIDSEYVVAGGHVASMDADIGDLPTGDIHVRDGEIVAVGPSLDVEAPRLEADGMVAMPGLIDTHTHFWTTLFRAMSSSSPETAYFALNVGNGRRCEPDDLFHGARLGLVDALHHGITTIHDWAHNLRSPEHADGNLRAHEAVGLRGRFSYGVPQGHPVDALADLDDIERVRREWFESARLPLMHLGVAGRQPGLAPPEVYRPEYESATACGLPVSYHANATRAHGALETVRQLGDEGMLTPATQLVHALYTSEAERGMIRDAGASVSISPWSELLIGYGVPPVRQFDIDGILFGLSADTLSLTGSGDPWSTIRLATGLYRAQAEEELVAPTRRMLELATIDAARCLGLDHLVGSLTPGKRADLILVRAHDLTTAPVTDLTNTLALAVGPENVDTVIVDGRIRQRGGLLVDLDVDEIVRETEAALAALLTR